MAQAFATYNADEDFTLEGELTDAPQEKFNVEGFAFANPGYMLFLTDQFSHIWTAL